MHSATTPIWYTEEEKMLKKPEKKSRER